MLRKLAELERSTAPPKLKHPFDLTTGRSERRR
jgi:hypothetical protein